MRQPDLKLVGAARHSGPDGTIAKFRRGERQLRRDLQRAEATSARRAEIIERFLARLPIQYREQVRGAGLPMIGDMSEREFGALLARLTVILEAGSVSV